MANYAGRLLDSDGNEIVRGNDFDVMRTITDVPAGAVITTAWLTIKQYTNLPDSGAIIQKRITPAAVPGIGQIVDVGADQVGGVIFQLTRNDTNLLVQSFYYYDIKVLTDTDIARTVEKGVLLPQGQITLATS